MEDQETPASSSGLPESRQRSGLSSILSDAPDVDMRGSSPRRKSRTGISGIMNSPTADDDVDSDSKMDTIPDERMVYEEMKEDDDEEGEVNDLRRDLLASIQAYAKADNKPPSKRQKKGKQKPKAKAQLSGEAALEEIQTKFRRLQKLIEASAASPPTIQELIACCLRLYEQIQKNQALPSAVQSHSTMATTNHASVNISATADYISTHPIYSLLFSCLHSCFASSYHDQIQLQYVRQIIDWCFTSRSSSRSLWPLTVLATSESFSITRITFTSFLHDTADDRVDEYITFLESLTTEHQCQITDVFQEHLDLLASQSSPLSVAHFVRRSILLFNRSALITQSCDASIERVLTPSIVTALIKNFSVDTTNGQSVHAHSSLQDEILQLLEARGSQLRFSAFYILTLLQDLCLSQSVVYSFYNELIRRTHADPTSSFLAQIAKSLRYIAHLTVSLARELDASYSEGRKQQLDMWKPWLQNCLSHGALDTLIQTDLVQAESSLELENCRSILSLMLAVAQDDTPHLHAVLSGSCNPQVPKKHQRRLLQLLSSLWSNATVPSLDSPTQVSSTSVVEQLCRGKTWIQDERLMNEWKESSGANFFGPLLQLCLSDDPIVSYRALDLLPTANFTTLEQPQRQQQWLMTGISVLFYLLSSQRQHFLSPSKPFHPPHLGHVKKTITRLVRLRGGVARYPASVSTTFFSLFLNTLFDMTSPTSVPAHFSFDKDEAKVRLERTSTPKVSTLQTSKSMMSDATITYRKPIDHVWAQELEAAKLCSMHANDVLNQLLLSGDERLIKRVVDLVLEKALPCCGLPSDDSYKETLPNRSSFDMDLRIEHWLNHYPSFLPLLHSLVQASVSLNAAQHTRLVPLIKSCLVVLMGHWNSVKGELAYENMEVPPYMRNAHQLHLSCDLMRLLALTNWLPSGLSARTSELLPLVRPGDIRGILFACWYYLSDYPPDKQSGSSNNTPLSTPVSSRPSSPANSPGLSDRGSSSMEFYLVPLRRALHRNMSKIGGQYPKFMV